MRKRVLLDENLPHALRKYISEHETVTAVYAGLAGYKNGELLKAAIEANFDVLVTGDQTLHYEQNLREHKIAVVCLSVNAWQILKLHGRLQLLSRRPRWGRSLGWRLARFQETESLPLRSYLKRLLQTSSLAEFIALLWAEMISAQSWRRACMGSMRTAR